MIKCSYYSIYKYKRSLDDALKIYILKNWNIKKNEQILKQYDLSKLNEDNLKHFNRSFIKKTVEADIKVFTNKTPSPNRFTEEFYLAIKEALTSSSSNCSLK